MSNYHIDRDWCFENPNEAAHELERLHRWCDELETERDALAAHIEAGKAIKLERYPSRALHKWAETAPTTSLARLKAEWQADAIEWSWKQTISGEEEVGRTRMRERIAELRRQAEGGE